MLACRDVQKGQQLALDLSLELGRVRRSQSGRGRGTIRVEELDLASLASVRALAARWEASRIPLDGLINNAGISDFGGGPQETADGFEQHYQVNFLAPFLLTVAMAPALERGRVKRALGSVGSVNTGGRVAVPAAGRAALRHRRGKGGKKGRAAALAAAESLGSPATPAPRTPPLGPPSDLSDLSSALSKLSQESAGGDGASSTSSSSRASSPTDGPVDGPARRAAPSLVVSVSSLYYAVMALRRDDLSFAEPGAYKPWGVYAHSKLCQVLFSHELTRRQEGEKEGTLRLAPRALRSEVVFPGFVRTNIVQGASWLRSACFHYIMYPILLAPEQGCRSTLVAVAEWARAADGAGEAGEGQAAFPRPYAYDWDGSKLAIKYSGCDDDDAAWLWDRAWKDTKVDELPWSKAIRLIVGA